MQKVFNIMSVNIMLKISCTVLNSGKNFLSAFRFSTNLFQIKSEQAEKKNADQIFTGLYCNVL